MEGGKFLIQVWDTYEGPQQNLSFHPRSLRDDQRTRNVNGEKNKTTDAIWKPLWFLTLRDEQAVTRLAATMKSRMSIVAPGRPIEKKRGEQCLMMVFTMSCETKRNGFIRTD